MEKDQTPEGGGGDKGKPVPTHVSTTPNKRPPTKLEAMKTTMASGEYSKQIVNYFMGDKQEALRFQSAAIEYVRRVPELLECSPISVMMAVVTVAQFRFLPSGVSGEAYIIPYAGEAKFQLGYKGIITLLYRSPKISTIATSIIHKNDKFEYEEGLSPKLVHTPAAFGSDPGEAIGVYSVVQMKDGGRTFKVMSRAQVMAIKDTSKAKNSSKSPWNNNDPELWMWRKTCIIQHAKTLPTTPEFHQALEKDYEGEGLDKPMLDAGGPAVGRALHAPDNSQE